MSKRESETKREKKVFLYASSFLPCVSPSLPHRNNREKAEEQDNQYKDTCFFSSQCDQCVVFLQTKLFCLFSSQFESGTKVKIGKRKKTVRLKTFCTCQKEETHNTGAPLARGLPARRTEITHRMQANT